ncbi:MAG TPA: mercuric transporter MerT family protein [Longimicrobiales bacterium]|nr:mercuric transporter MerT family protein [Longimicrobiales bacterium]
MADVTGSAGAAEEEGVRSRSRGLLASAGAVGAAFLGALCCIGPVLFVVFGVGAGLASTFEPLRPVFGALMVAALGFGFYTAYGSPAQAGGEGGPAGDARACAVPRSRSRERVVLWSATVVALVLWSFPTWSNWLI